MLPVRYATAPDTNSTAPEMPSATAPSSRAVFTIDDPMPELSTGRLESAEAFTGTTTMSKLIPASPSAR